MRRYDPQHVAVEEAVKSGAFGKPVVFKGWHRELGVQQRVESLRTGQPAGADAWDGYASLVVAADACIASLRSGSSQKVAKLEPPALYASESSGVVR
jgi:predicted dehydrogenase